MQKRSARQRVEPDLRVQGQLFGQLDLQDVTEEIPERALAECFEPAGRNRRPLRRCQVQLRSRLRYPAVENGEPVRGAFAGEGKSAGEMRIARGDQALSVNHFFRAAHSPEPPIALGQCLLSLRRSERVGRSEPVVQRGLVSFSLA